MPLKELTLLARDIGFYVTGAADVEAADWPRDPWLYPLDWGYQLDREAEYFAPRDEAGVPLRQFPGTLGTHYLPSRIAGYALAQWNRHRATGSATARDAFLACARWFRDAPDQLYWHRFSVAGLPVPWLSCIAQGEGASVLARAAIDAPGEPGWADAARRALDPLLVPVREGGLQSQLPDGRPFLEEYPNSPYKHVLNGCLYAIVGLLDVARLGGADADRLRGLARALADAVVHNIAHWEWRGWSNYDYADPADPVRNLNTMTYQLLQIELLRFIGAELDDARLSEIAGRWRRAADRPAARMSALVGKLGYRLRHRYGAH